jgi:hypothetical protein
MAKMHFVIVLTMLVVGSSASDFDYDYGSEVDPCYSFYDSDSAGECHHDKVPNTTFQQLFGPNVRACCSSNSYRFHDHCEVKLNIPFFEYFIETYH